MKCLKYLCIFAFVFLATHSLVLAYYSFYSRTPEGEIYEGDSVFFTTDAYSCLLSNGEGNETICRADGTNCGEQIDNCDIYGASWTAKVNPYEYSYIFAVYDENMAAIADSFDVLPR